ncbi:MAG: hypothetical protein KBT13_10615 [Bacteroidales bacterium]|nr:hypothetical protein [Candidatus Sodaliphilus limicaballi]
MRKILLTILGGVALVAGAQQVTVVEHKQLLKDVEGPAFYPVLSADGSKMLYSTIQNPGLKLYDFTDDVTVRISDAAGVGQDAFFGGDGKVYYVTAERRDDNMLYRTGYSYDVKSCRNEVVLEAQHGAVLPMKATRGVALKAQSRTFASSSKIGTAVYTEGATVHVTVNGKDRSFSPVESVGYLWSSLSPDGSRVAFFAAGKGIVVMDLEGNVIKMLGNYEMPSWLNNDYIVAQNTKDDGHQFTSSQIMLLKADGSFKHELTKPSSMSMQPSAAAGKVVYSSIDGLLYMMQINITE